VIITGIATGQEIQVHDLGTARVATKLPLLVGSGVTPDSVKDLFAWADGLIVGSWYKRDGFWANEPDVQRARELVKAVHSARKK
jgi:predicted TIM-barrel enzyme